MGRFRAQMKCVVLAALLLAAGMVPAAGQAPSSKLERTWLLGREYVRLDDWARANNLQVRWLSRQEVRVSGRWDRLTFTGDSRKMQINGINVWLSFAIAMRNGAAYISPLDLTTAVQPVLFPPRNPSSRPIRHICLDPGHGGKDPGNRERAREEKLYALLLAREVSAQLKEAGFQVSLTRSSDRTMDLVERTELARRRGADLFLSLHYNSADGAGGAAVKGLEVYCLTPAKASSTNARGEGGGGAVTGNGNDARNMLLAFQLQKWIVQNTGMEDRGVKRARFQVLRDASMPAAMVEAGFMTHPTESMRIYDAMHRQKMARAITEALIAYKRIVDGTTALRRKR